MKLLFLIPLAATLVAQVPNPTQKLPEEQADTSGSQPVFRVTVVQRTTKAVSYRNRSGWTKLDFRGTTLAPDAKGSIEVNSRPGYTEIKATVSKLAGASKYGPEYLTYVLWAITPEGRSTNLGEVLLDGDHGGLDVTTDLQAFGLVITAEPYFGVTQPSDVVVMENVIRQDTLGKFEEIDAKYELLRRGQYSLHASPRDLKPMAIDTSKTPLELYEARNAVQIARWSAADKYASDTFEKAAGLLDQAENYQKRNAGKKPVRMTAREAVQTAENARIISLKRQDEERLAQERQAAADREAKANAEAEKQARLQREEAERRARAEADRAVAENARNAAEQARAEADRARKAAESERIAAEQAKAEADRARIALAAEADRAKNEADRAKSEADRARSLAADADRARRKAEADQAALRAQLLQQLNLILETRDTARGLIVNMADVLFDTGKFALRPLAREKLAKLSGIVLSHPGLNLAVEGHTDSVGGDEYNQKLSEQRADSVRSYLLEQGLTPDQVTATGFGKTQPVASNDTAQGRQQNRRVELVVSGEVIGTQIGVLKSGSAQ